MWWLVLVAFGVLGYAAVSLRFIPPPSSPTMLLVKQGELHVRRGQVLPHARQSVAETLQDEGVSSGFIAISAASRLVFSRTIPPELHQRLRNILLNQR